MTNIYETGLNIQTKKEKTSQKSWFFEENGIGRWQKDLVAPSDKRPTQDFCLIKMLPKKQRIPKALAREVFGRGAGSSSQNFLLKLIKSPAGQTRFAVSISKKVAPTAVLRNRTRRRVYSVIRGFLPRVKSGFLVAITVKKGGEKLPYAGIEKEIEELLSRAKMF